MTHQLVDVSDTKKQLSIEIPVEVVDTHIERVTRSYSKSARIPGFRRGKVPATVVKQRFKAQILQEVARELVPRAIDDALKELGVEPVESPDVQDITINEGKPLTFTAAFETVPAFDPGDLTTIVVRRPPSVPQEGAVDAALQQLRERAGRVEPVEGRPVADGDTAVLDIQRTDPGGASEKHEAVAVTLGASGSPPGFDANLIGLPTGAEKTFAVYFPEDYAVPTMANTNVTYHVVVKEIRQRVLPPLDDELAKDLGDFESLAALRERVEADVQREAESSSHRQVRTDLLKQLSSRVPFELPTSLLEREMDRRVEEFARRLMEQQIDPRQANIDWAEFREAQRAPARDAVSSAIALDEVARREELTVTTEAIDAEVERVAGQMGRTPEAVRAQIEKDGGISRIYLGLRREMAVDLMMARANIVTAQPTQPVDRP
jgi:trigger factor